MEEKTTFKEHFTGKGVKKSLKSTDLNGTMCSRKKINSQVLVKL